MVTTVIKRIKEFQEIQRNNVAGSSLRSLVKSGWVDGEKMFEIKVSKHTYIQWTRS